MADRRDKREVQLVDGSQDRHTKDDGQDGSDMAPRSCTDIFCLIIFIASLAGLGYILVYSLQHGNPKRLTHGYDWKGELCGVDENVSTYPMLYWCADSSATWVNGMPSALNTKAPICVAKCPKVNNDTQLPCLAPSTGSTVTSGTQPYITDTITIVQTVKPQQSYPTKTILGRYCIPDLSAVPAAEQAASSLVDSLTNSSGPIGDHSQKILDAVGGLRRCWMLLIGTAILAIILGYVYLFILKMCAKPLVYLCLFIVLALSICAGIFFVIGETGALSGAALDKWKVYNPFYNEHLNDSAAKTCSLVSGGICLLIGLILLCLIFCGRDAIEVAIGVIEAACDCLFSMPSMLLTPVTDVAIKMVLVAALLYFATWVITIGTLNTSKNFSVQGKEVGGLRRSFTYTREEKIMLGWYVFMCFWLLELLNSVGQFALSYAVVKWYYTEDKKTASWCLTCVGYLWAYTVHLGSMAVGSFLVAVCRVANMMLKIAQYAQGDDGNAALKCCLYCMDCCISCFQKIIEFVNKNAYIDIAIGSTNFCTAAKHVFAFIAEEATEIAILNGACTIFVFAGILCISASDAAITYLLVTNVPRWTDEESDNHVSSPFFVAGVAFVIAAIISYSFMMLFDHTADTLLYTYAWNRYHGNNTVDKYAPDSLKNLTGYEKIKSKSKDKGGGGGWFSSIFGGGGGSKSSSKGTPEEEKPLVGSS